VRIEIPKQLYSRLKKRAAAQGISLGALVRKVLSADFDKPLSKRRAPIIDSDMPGSLELDNAKIYELIDFP
jgi:plasmid stability protein